MRRGFPSAAVGHVKFKNRLARARSTSSSVSSGSSSSRRRRCRLSRAHAPRAHAEKDEFKMVLPPWFGPIAWPFADVCVGEFYVQPDRPTPAERRRAVEFFERVFPSFVLCVFCLPDYRRQIVADPPDTATRDRLFAWLTRLHDAVNVRIGHPVFGLRRARAQHAARSDPEKRRIVRLALQMLAFEYALYIATERQRETDERDRQPTVDAAQDADGREEEARQRVALRDMWRDADMALRGEWLFYTRAPWIVRKAPSSSSPTPPPTPTPPASTARDSGSGKVATRSSAAWWFATYGNSGEPGDPTTLADSWRDYGTRKLRVYSAEATKARAKAAQRRNEAVVRKRDRGNRNVPGDKGTSAAVAPMTGTSSEMRNGFRFGPAALMGVAALGVLALVAYARLRKRGSGQRRIGGGGGGGARRRRKTMVTGPTQKSVPDAPVDGGNNGGGGGGGGGNNGGGRRR
jgi:hypothetical protein